MSPTTTFEPGTLLRGRYRLVGLVASGGMAQVWRAEDEILTRPVAVKVLHPHLALDDSFVARFRREAVAAARLAHPSIVAIYDTCDDPPAIVMELVEGRTLRDELDRRGFLPPAEAVAIAAGIADALAVAHKAGIVHRDVKPANVLLSPDGLVKVTDFGIAKAAAESEPDPDLPDLTSQGLLVGTAKYLAPEQVDGRPVDARTDVYGLGVVLYEMLCGRVPFDGETDAATAVARLRAAPPRPRTVLRTIPEQLDAVVMRALATHPADRHQSVADLRAELLAAPTSHAGAALAPPHVAADAAVVGGRTAYARTERSWLVPTALVSLVAVALAVAWMLIGGTAVTGDIIDLVDRVRPGGGAASADTSLTGSELRVAAFDPIGGDGEHDSLLPLLLDGDQATEWTSERYRSRQFGGLKPGVGLVIDTGESRTLRALLVDSARTGWSAEVRVSEEGGTTLADWGEPVGRVEAAGSGRTRIDVGGARGSQLLLWITDLGTGAEHRAQIAELGVETA